MASHFAKTMLRVGSYHSPDGRVDITPSRIRHWAEQFRRLTAANQVVPMHWDHGTDGESLQPVSASQFRSARNTVGRLKDFRPTADGRAAEVVFETVDPAATAKVASNAVYVSPVIFPRWRDGQGNEYRDLITHMDIVDHPVDHSQTPARPMEAITCCLRMGMGTRPFTLGLEDGMRDTDIDDTGPGADEQTDIDIPVDDADDTPGDGQPGVGDLMLALADHGIILPDDTTLDNFLDRLVTALIAKKGSQPGGPGEDVTTPQDGGFDSGDTTIASPQIATMSTATLAALRFGGQEYRKRLASSLDRLLRTGRCTPAEHAAKRAELDTVKLSLDATGQPKQSTLSIWLEAREGLPKGACWDSAEKLRRMSARVVDQPDARALLRDPARLEGAELDAAVKTFLKR